MIFSRHVVRDPEIQETEAPEVKNISELPQEEVVIQLPRDKTSDNEDNSNHDTLSKSETDDEDNSNRDTLFYNEYDDAIFERPADNDAIRAFENIKKQCEKALRKYNNMEGYGYNPREELPEILNNNLEGAGIYFN